MIRTILFTCLLGFAIQAYGQSFNVEGYAYESGNRGFLYGVEVKAYDGDKNLVATAYSDNDGFFEFEVPAIGTYDLDLVKSYFNPLQEQITVEKAKTFLKYEMKREPGYFFEVTLAESRTSEDQVVDQIKGALIEVYNNTKKESVMVLEDHQDHEFKLHMSKGNHYTILIRKEGYLAKRMEAFVNVEGCILCFEGVGDVKPGVTDNLTEGNQNGVLLANVAMDSLFRGKKLAINNLYYDLGKWDLKAEGKDELDKVITMMTDNPHLTLELGAHTDSRGQANSNMSLSEKRAQSAVSYLRSRGVISSRRINFKGYGESEIINGCADGVDCSEEQHARNRRTELKIVGIDSDGSIKKTLAQMKQEEFMDELLAEIENQGVIKIVDGDTSQLDLMEKQNAIKKEEARLKAEANNKIIENAAPEIIDDSGLANRTLEEEKIVSVIEEVPTKEMMEDSHADKMMDEKPTKIMADDMPSDNMTEEKSMVGNHTDTVMEEKPMTKVVDDVPVKEDMTEVAMTDVNMEGMVKTNANVGFTGYKIVIKESDSALDPDHQMWKKHTGLQVYFDGSKFLYSIGEFTSQAKTEDIRSSGIGLEYPNSYIAEFVNGILVE